MLCAMTKGAKDLNMLYHKFVTISGVYLYFMSVALAVNVFCHFEGLR